MLHRGVAEHGVEGVEAAGQVAASELLGREDGPARHPTATTHTRLYPLTEGVSTCQRNFAVVFLIFGEGVYYASIIRSFGCKISPIGPLVS